MHKPGVFPLLTLALLAGCATTADVEKAKASWRGATYDEVVAAWGQPANQETHNTGLRGTWISQSAGTGSSLGVFGGSGGGGVGISLPLPGTGGTENCQRTLSFEEGRVVDQLWQGTTQFCSIFRR